VGPDSRIVILGAGPTGLGAAWRLRERGYEAFTLYEADTHVGGLARSFVDEAGFTWDIGGHVQFSHYPYYDAVLDAVVPADQWLQHERSSWVWMQNRFIPYPLQHNIHRLPPHMAEHCLTGLRGRPADGPDLHACSFREWIDSCFGSGLAECFMLPYNEKVWGFPAETMSATWIGERVARPDLDVILESMQTGQDNISWGPNRTFRFPLTGGTGSIFERVAAHLALGNHLRLAHSMTCWSPSEQRLDFDNGDSTHYDALINTIPADVLLACAEGRPDYAVLSRGFRRSATNIIGIGIRGRVPPHLADKCWMYFPEPDLPFYRVTVFSNYSPRNAPDGCWSLMLEVSESTSKPVDQARLVDDVMAGAMVSKLLTPGDDIVSCWHHRVAHGYPTPWLGRDAHLTAVEAALRPANVWSRGRFGAWKYEVANQDHSFMQGVEAVDSILDGTAEVTLTQP
jgi:protoporphyrinogen oxidase